MDEEPLKTIVKYTKGDVISRCVCISGMAFVGTMLLGPLGAAIGSSAGYLLADPIMDLVDKVKSK